MQESTSELNIATEPVSSQAAPLTTINVTATATAA